MDEHVYLTPNRRLYHYWQNQKQISSDAIFTLDEFWQQLWRQSSLQSQWHCLSSQSALLLFENIIESSEYADPLFNCYSTAQLAYSAWLLCQQWQLPIEKLAQSHQDDVQAFYQWASRFEQTLEEKKWLTNHALPHQLSRDPELKSVLPKSISLVGFNELTPNMQSAMEVLQQYCALNQDQFTPRYQQKTGRLVIASDIEQEIAAIAEWVKDTLSDYPKPFIGVVVPNLLNYRKAIQRIFDQQLDCAYNMSAPLSLLHYPLIDSADLALKLLKPTLDFTTISTWLRHPLFSGGSLNERIQLELKIRDVPRLEWTLAALKTQAESNELTEQIQRLLTLQESLPKRADCETWCRTIEKCLQIVSWPGDRRLNTEEYHLQALWRETLEQYKQLAPLLGQHSYGQACYRIHQLLGQVPFLPETPQSPVQVLGVLEAAGLPFDALWFQGLQRETWPPAPNPNPFLPIALQKQLRMARCDADREWQVAKQLTTAFQQGIAGDLVFSCSSSYEDEDSGPSLLLKNLPTEITKVEKVSQSSKAQLFEINQHLQSLPLSDEEKKQHYSSRTLQLQADCPFRAFAETRLGAKPLQQAGLGLSAAERGTLLHEVLATITKKCKNLHHEAVYSIAKQSIANVLNAWQQQHGYWLRSGFLAVETQRLELIVTKWIEAERAREPYTIIASEKSYQTQVGEMSLRLRIDRIDEVNGEKIILDYKTGLVTLSGCFGERPKQLQLPLYCLTHPLAPKGMGFIKLLPDQVSISAVGHEDIADKTIKTLAKSRAMVDEKEWEQQTHVWQQNLDRLAAEFVGGRLDVMPNEPNVCLRCRLQSLCRIGE